jgi:hypothetical protein
MARIAIIPKNQNPAETILYENKYIKKMDIEQIMVNNWDM